MNWFYLFIAGILEIGWPLGFKLSQTKANQKLLWVIFAVICMAGSGYFLWLASKTIPIGTAYAIWTGTGAIGAFLIGIVWFNDSVSVFRLVSATLLITGIIGLKLSS